MGTQIQVPITKAKGAAFIVDGGELSDLFQANGDIYQRVIEEGLKVLLNGRMSKLPATKDMEGAALENAKTLALEKAAENYSMLKAGKLVKKTASATSKASNGDRAVMLEAIRQAKEVAKGIVRKKYGKVSTVTAKQLTEMATLLVERNPSYLVQAKEALAERAKLELPDLEALVPELVAKAAEAKAEREKNKPLSAKQAGKTTKRAGDAKPVPSRKSNVSTLTPVVHANTHNDASSQLS